MPYVLDSTGLTIKTLDEAIADVNQRLVDTIDEALDVSEESELGQVVGAFCDEVRQLAELFQAGFVAQDPAQGSGVGLRQVASITGTVAKPATKSLVTCTLDIDAGTYAPGDLVAYAVGDPSARFVNRDTVTAPGGSLTGQVFEAETAGPLRAPSGTLTVIAEPVAGWNSITNPLDAVLGSLEESDTTLRQRRVRELYRRGSTSLDAIRADLETVPDVTSVIVEQNDTDATVGALTPHSVRATVLGGTDLAVATQLWASKAAGIATIGTTSVSIVDSQGVTQTVKIQRPSTLTVYLDITVLGDQAVWSNTSDLVAAVKNALVDWGDANLGAGQDVILSRLAREVGIAVPGILDAYDLQIGTSPSPSSTANLTVAPTQIADLDTSRITVTASLGSWP